MDLGKGLTIFAFVFGMGSSHPVLSADALTRPTLFHYQAGELADECSVVRGVAGKMKTRQSEIRVARLNIGVRLSESRRRLEECGNALGAIEETLLAQVCSGLYQDWLKTGIELESIEQERDDLLGQMESLRDLLDYRCQSLPPGVILSVRRSKH